MNSTILILIIITISYFISKYVVENCFHNSSTILQIVLGIISFYTISYIFTSVQKGGPQRAVFMDSIVVLTMIPLFPFILLYRFLFET
jgi:hypothetical protein